MCEYAMCIYVVGERDRQYRRFTKTMDKAKWGWLYSEVESKKEKKRDNQHFTLKDGGLVYTRPRYKYT